METQFFAAALRASDSFDVVHSHIGASLIPFGGLSSAPVLHTVHAGLDSVDEHWILSRHPEAHIAAISDSVDSGTKVIAKKREVIDGLKRSIEFYVKERDRRSKELVRPTELN